MIDRAVDLRGRRRTAWYGFAPTDLPPLLSPQMGRAATQDSNQDNDWLHPTPPGDPGSQDPCTHQVIFSEILTKVDLIICLMWMYISSYTRRGRVGDNTLIINNVCQLFCPFCLPNFSNNFMGVWVGWSWRLRFKYRYDGRLFSCMREILFLLSIILADSVFSVFSSPV